MIMNCITDCNRLQVQSCTPHYLNDSTGYYQLSIVCSQNTERYTPEESVFPEAEG